MKRGKDLLYPDRHRCFRCGQFFAFTVIEQLYCSYACADMIPPEDIPRKQWPRTHVNADGEPKRYYNTPLEASSMRLRTGQTAYYDAFCGGWHIGTLRLES